jgi:hypothetical protein
VSVKQLTLQSRKRRGLPLLEFCWKDILLPVFHEWEKAEKMRKRTKIHTAFLGVALLFCGVGCGDKDVEGMTRVCQKVSEKGVDLSGGKRSKAATSWQALRGCAGDSGLDSRVTIRLNWDKALVDTDIEVSVSAPGVVKLHGTVTKQTQKERALDLAKSTQGVTDVEDGLEIK